MVMKPLLGLALLSSANIASAGTIALDLKYDDLKQWYEVKAPGWDSARLELALATREQAEYLYKHRYAVYDYTYYLGLVESFKRLDPLEVGEIEKAQAIADVQAEADAIRENFIATYGEYPEGTAEYSYSYGTFSPFSIEISGDDLDWKDLEGISFNSFSHDSEPEFWVKNASGDTLFITIGEAISVSSSSAFAALDGVTFDPVGLGIGLLGLNRASMSFGADGEILDYYFSYSDGDDADFARSFRASPVEYLSYYVNFDGRDEMTRFWQSVSAPYWAYSGTLPDPATDPVFTSTPVPSSIYLAFGAFGLLALRARKSPAIA